ncbi:dTDP-4-dehydrorhamnose reductase [Streptomyces lunaelactis]|uniref:dTDP-4-dehydrorhamnose reductase n=1 Tax=Streptomyces lunaelactis TaxID=1535768 RepID=UPI001584829F|nr:dTDP-4-dehydrorhamnose reductase [Streptomyces lunaelactis]NUK11107.1 dTDP-4-dehydrorhamnose reductase [Streptomyces lunaelactis]NUK25264.1 dTDP-4-dehydrorhamnose reductase [Streptomyces lunaelactis]NUK37176.1 dTDP-4-dehydrorhamnose reductase [Streptomyces lunaelactis]NUK43447.1 dTDP-4-dehydrorhamnose reductase [Streptomyces lunaelactis]NUK52939.1 dTDP-4-dehydrorhamnose reductase [Streptomyces lunaelactis]
MTTSWLVTGARGLLGRDVLAELGADPDAAVTGLSRDQLDITDPTAVRTAVDGHRVVVNCAAWTDVDGAEQAEAAATAVNGTGVRHLARACADSGAVLLHISTDYVFPGDARQPYPEDAPTSPVNAYGRGKLAGERAVVELLPRTGYVVRTAWLYGAHGSNFVATMLRLAAQREMLDVVADQHGQPTWSRALAGQLAVLGRAALAGRAPAGIYHGTAGGHTTWYGLARETFRLSGLDPERIRPVGSVAFPRPAARPAFGVLGHSSWPRTGLVPLPRWDAQLTAALDTPAFAALAAAARSSS